MLATIFFYLDSYWLAWTGLFPSLPLWSPHGAVMALIISLATVVLGGIYILKFVNR
jgi:hypothetical protein